MAGKIVFAAPSRPLVLQQIEACHNIGGIPQVRKLFHLTPLSLVFLKGNTSCACFYHILRSLLLLSNCLQEWAIDLTGQTNPTRRAYHWKSKRVFFVTPQVLEKDIYSGKFFHCASCILLKEKTLL